MGSKPPAVRRAPGNPWRASITIPLLLLGVAALLLAGCASIETGPPADVAGRWTGECYNCPVRAFTLVLAQDRERLEGTLQAAGRSRLGESPMPLRDGKVAGRTVKFRTLGADGVTLDVSLDVSKDGRSLLGKGEHGAAFGLRFSRAGR